MPKPQLDLRGTSSQADETLEGVLEKVVFANPENGWSVLKLSVPGKRGAVTAVGNVAGVQPAIEVGDHQRTQTSIPSTASVSRSARTE